MTSKNSTKIPPAEGERRAARGYNPQYRIAAELVYLALESGKLDWVRVADPDAGRVDDIQIGTRGRVDAYQVKWSEYPSARSFNDIIKKRDNKPCIIKQLADGWQRLRANNKDSRAVVHFITNDHASSSPNAQIPVGDPPPRPCHFQAFLRHAWKPFHDETLSGSYEDNDPWRPALEEMRNATGLGKLEFVKFVRDCELEFGFVPPIRAWQRASELPAVEEDIQQLAAFLWGIAGSEELIVELTTAELLRRLGWTKRFEFRFRHEFPVDESLYVPVQTTVAAIEQTLMRFNKGYIALVGSPGSGKSTLLTQTFRYRASCRTIRYYAFVRDDIGLGRGEAIHFLHDLVLALRDHGFWVPGKIGTETREELQKHLETQLALASANWAETSIKTVIVVDGLDHIEREQKPSRSLLADLPLPDQVPAGVIFVLGSQKTDLVDLPTPIKQQVAEDRRTIIMQPLTRASTIAVIDKCQMAIIPTASQKDRVFELTAGHPLALYYMLQRINLLESEDDLETLLIDACPYQESIETEYKTYWEALKDEEDIRDLLSLVCRIRGVFEFRRLADWTDRRTVRRLLKSAGQYFRVEGSERRSFFHNSFRQFLLIETAKGFDGEYDDEIDRSYYSRLAVLAARCPRGDHFGWEELYYLAKSGEDREIAKLATQDHFRSQFFGLRSMRDIGDDIGLAIQSAGQQRDIVTIIRLLLIEAELDQRTFHLESIELAELLLRLGDIDLAVKQIRRGDTLQVEPIEALKFARKLARTGYEAEARRLFDLAEPLQLLSGTDYDKHRYHDKWKELKTWSRIAVYVRPLDQILKAIGQIKADKNEIPYWDEDEFRAAMLLQVGYELINIGEMNSLETVRSALMECGTTGRDYDISLSFELCRRANLSGDTALATKELEIILSKEPDIELDDQERTEIAELAYRVKGDEETAWQWLAGIEQPAIVIGASDYGKFYPYIQRLRLNRLLAALGKDANVVDAVPDADKQREQGNVYYERMLCLIGRVWGWAWAGRKMSQDEVVRELTPAIRLFNRSWRETHDWTMWSSVQATRDEFYNALIHAAAQHGEEAVSAIAAEFDREWNAEKSLGYWPTQLRRKISFSLQRAGQFPQQTVERLARIEKIMIHDQDVQGRISECVSQAHAWITVGETGRARNLIHKINEVSFGVQYEKDDQFWHWMKWLGRANGADPNGAKDRFLRYGPALIRLRETSGGATLHEASQQYLLEAFRWSPNQAVEISKWLYENGTVRYCDAFEAIIEGALDSVEPPLDLLTIFTSNLYFPFAQTGNEHIARRFVEASWRNGGESVARNTVQCLLDGLDTRAYPSIRGAWKTGFAIAWREQGGDASWITGPLSADEVPSDYNDSVTLRLKDGSELNRLEVQNRVNGYEDFVKLVQQCTDNSSFPWEKPLGKIINDLDRAQTLALVDSFGQNAFHRVLGLLSQRLEAIGEVSNVERIVQTMIDQSKPEGWVRYYDGGTRILAFERLVAIDPKKGHDCALESFANDIVEHRWTRQLLAELHRILPVLTDDVPVAEVWSEIEEHVGQLYEMGAETVLMPCLQEMVSDDSVERALLFLLSLLLRHPVPEIHASAHRTFAELVRRYTENDLMKSVVLQCLSSDEQTQLRMLLVLEAARLTGDEVIAPFDEVIGELCSSADCSIRMYAMKMTQSLGNLPEVPVQGSCELPPIYRLHLPEPAFGGRIMPFDAVEPGEPFPDTDDPLELIRPFNDWFELLSKITGIPYYNLCIRGVNIMRHLKPYENWSADAERKLRNQLYAADLQLSFRRARTSLARRAYDHIIVELIDSGKLDYRQAASLKIGQEYIDPAMSMKVPVRRPSFISKPVKRDFGESDQDWLDDIDTALGEIRLSIDDGRIVLGELTRIRDLGWKLPEETRLSMLCGDVMSTPQKIDKVSDLLPTETIYLSNRYSRMEPYGGLATCILRGHPYFADVGSDEWLAFNPVVGHRLGWKISSDGLFRWVDEDGKVIVESIWWMDGPFERMPPRLDEFVAQGWVILAASEAVDQIRSEFGELKYLLAVRRKLIHERDDDHRMESRIIERSLAP